MRYRATYCNDPHFTAKFDAKSHDEAVKIAVEANPDHWLSCLETTHELPSMLYLVWFEELHDDGDRTPKYETVWAWCPTDAVRRVTDRYYGKINPMNVFTTIKTTWSK